MSATAAKNLRVSVATTVGGSYTNVAGIESCQVKFGKDLVDVTTLTDSDIVRLNTIRDCEFTLTGNFETDASGQGAIRTSYDTDSDLFIKVLWNGTVGWKVQALCDDISFGGGVKDKVAVTYGLKGSGAKTAV